MAVGNRKVAKRPFHSQFLETEDKGNLYETMEQSPRLRAGLRVLDGLFLYPQINPQANVKKYIQRREGLRKGRKEGASRTHRTHNTLLQHGAAGFPSRAEPKSPRLPNR